MNCERHSLYLFGALVVVRCTYILCIFIYILYIYKILQAWVCSFSNTTKANFTPSPHYLHSNDTLMWPLAVFYTLHKILTEVREQCARKVSENRYLAPIRALVGFRTIWRYQNDFEFGAWTQVEILYHLTYHGKYSQKGRGIVSYLLFLLDTETWKTSSMFLWNA